MEILKFGIEIFPLALIVGVPFFVLVIRRRRLARMTAGQRLLYRAEERRETSQWHDDQIDPTNLSGWTNPDSGAYVGRHDGD